MYSWMIFAVICAYIVKGMCGFANTLVFSTILSFKTNNIAISPLELIVGYPSNVILTWKNRKKIDPHVWIPLAIFVVIGNIPGIFFLKMGDARIVKLVFGVVIVGIAIEMFLREYQKKEKETNRIVLATIGVLSGVLSGLFGIGALLAAYVGRTTNNNEAFKGNMCIVFLIENTFRICVYGFTGLFTFETVKNALILFPFMAIGLVCGMTLTKFLDERIVKKIVIVMLALSGISLIVHSIGNLI